MLMAALLPFPTLGLDWTGGSLVSSNWSDSANWGGTGIAAGDALVFDGTARLDNTNDTMSRTSYSSITFNPGAGPFVLDGNLINIANGITNNSPESQTINLGISFSNNITLDGQGNFLKVLAGLTNSVSAPVATTITLNGIGILANLFTGDYYPLETNIFVISSNANWSIVGDSRADVNDGPWAFQIASGTMFFGTPFSAPVFESDNQNGAPLDNEIATVTGATGVLNVINGTLGLSPSLELAVATNSTATINLGGNLAVSSNLATALASGSTAIIASGGSLTIGGQFQGANGTGPGEVSQLYAEYGTLTVGNGVGPLYIACCGTGSLILSNNAVVKCGTLDISRNANGNSFGSVGTVYLNGGTLTVNYVTNASANAQPGGNPTATFYFNGGTLAAKSGAVRTFFQGSKVAPVMPITALIQSGGAVIDVSVFNGMNAPITIGEPLQHDPALGAIQDGGLNKVDSGNLILTGVNTYNGNTVINSGALALSGNASIASSPEIIMVGNANTAYAATFDVSELSSAFTLGSGQTLSNSTSTAVIDGNLNTALGTLSLTYSSGTPSLSITNSVFMLASNTVLRINNTGTPLGVGTYTIITTNRVFNFGFGGTVSGTVPSSFTTSGGGIAPGTAASLQITNNILQLVVVPGPHLTNLKMHGASLTLAATNGPAGGQYVLVESTNPALPLNQWIPVLTNYFDVNGNQNLTTNILNPAAPMEFFRLAP